MPSHGVQARAYLDVCMFPVVLSFYIYSAFISILVTFIRCLRLNGYPEPEPTTIGEGCCGETEDSILDRSSHSGYLPGIGCFICYPGFRDWSLGGGTSFTALFADSPDVAVTAMGIAKIGASAVAMGAVSPVEVGWETPALRTNLSKNHYAYRFKLEERTANSFQLNENLKIELYGYNGWATTLLATLYAEQRQWMIRRWRG